MRFINAMLNEQEVNEQDLNVLKDMMQIIQERYDKLSMMLDENAEMVFTHHLVTLGKRMLAKEFVMIDEALMVEVSSTAWQMAQSLMEGIFESNGCSPQKAEIFLIATHIQVYLDKTKGGHTNE